MRRVGARSETHKLVRSTLVSPENRDTTMTNMRSIELCSLFFSKNDYSNLHRHRGVFWSEVDLEVANSIEYVILTPKCGTSSFGFGKYDGDVCP